MSALELTEAKKHLNITTQGDDTELQNAIDVAEAAIGQRVGPLIPTEVTVRVAGRRSTLALPVTPVISLTAVTMDGAATVVNVADLDVDSDIGLLAYAQPRRFSGGYYTVTYMAGWVDPPPDLLWAVKEMLRHLWTTQRASLSGRPSLTGEQQQEAAVPFGTFSLPNRVLELLEPYMEVAIG